MIDLDEIDLPLPRGFWVSALGGELLGPFAVGFGFVVRASVGLVDGVDGGFFSWDLATPLIDGGRGSGGGGGVHCAEAGRRSVVSGHARAGGVDDEGAVGACFLDELVEAGRQLFFAGDRVGAGVGVPHVANDDGGSEWVPLFLGCFFCVPGA